MEKLDIRQKQEWKSAIDDHWVRTGCRDLWDAVFIAFRDYRDAPLSTQHDMIHERIHIHPTPSEEWIGHFYKTLCEDYQQDDEDDPDPNKSMFFYLLPLKLISSEIIPYLQKYITMTSDCTIQQLCDEIMDKCVLLAEYRQKKKKVEQSTDELTTQIHNYLTTIFHKIQPFSYDNIQQAMQQIENQLIILSTQEKVLFDSKSWGEGMEGGDYQDVIIILAHPDGTYDSIGRISHTKDGNQKISRLFHYDDDAVEYLRR